MEVTTTTHSPLGQHATNMFETLKRKRSAAQQRLARRVKNFEVEIARMQKRMEEQQKKLNEKRREKAWEEFSHSDANVIGPRDSSLYTSAQNEEYVFLEAMHAFLEEGGAKEEGTKLALVDPRHVINTSNKHEFNLVRVATFENEEITFKNPAVQQHWLNVREAHPDISIRPMQTSYAVKRDEDERYCCDGYADALNEAGESVNRIAKNTDPLYGSLDELIFGIKEPLPSRSLVNQETHVALYGAGAGSRTSPDCTVVVHWIEVTRPKKM
jgi:hypothetical protein